MYTLGIAGGDNPIYSNEYGYGPGSYHDAACVLLEDGKVVCAIEEERLNRIKHSNKFPVEAIKYCLASRGLTLSDIETISINVTTDAELPGAMPGDFCSFLFQREFGINVPSNKFRFTSHHYSHAMSAFGCSGFDSALVATFDGQGEYLSSVIYRGTKSGLEQLACRRINDSLGFFYFWVTEFLGFKHFDEYKVMGLAPYGNPATYRDIFASMYQLQPEGSYMMSYTDQHHLKAILAKIVSPRKPHEPMIQVHKDIAASLQEALEVLMFHALRYWQKQTGERNLCLAGGVAHNCVANGKIARSGLFDSVFVQPASHDAGGSLGSALNTYHSLIGGDFKSQPLSDVYWGRELPTSDEIEERLSDWKDFIQFDKRSDIFADAAQMLADDKVIGWVQGKSEFGPRALGNRSILADARPAGNKDRINAMVKKREGFRPFAPAVPVEFAETYFDVSAKTNQFDFMTYTVEVKSEMRELLGAITHVNGTARIQTVNKKTNERFWELIMEFNKITGTPVLLNTSFNNNAEPIVESVDDAVTCFLTTGLDALVIDIFLITKKVVTDSDYANMLVSIRPFESLHRTLAYSAAGQWTPEYKIHVSYDESRTYAISEQIFKVLVESMTETKQRRLGDIIEAIGGLSQDETKAVVQELIELWAKRVVVLLPAKVL